MRVPVVEYVALALSTNLGYSALSPLALSVDVASLRVTDGPIPSCWAPSNGVAANYGP
jgi:hypothetical protein